MIEKLYTVDNVAEMLHVTRKTVYTYIHSGKMQAVKIGKHWRVTADSLQALFSGAAGSLS